MIYPIKNYINKKYPNGSVTQWFGENPELYQQASKDWGVQIKHHNGIDIVSPYGTPILATTDQTICSVKNDPSGYGRHIRAIDDQYEHTYGHLSLIIVKIGDTVKEGDVIGHMGNSGFVISGATPYWKYNPYAGTHLHYGIRKFTELGSGIIYWLGKKYYIADYPGDAGGAVDPVKIWEIEGVIEASEEEKIKNMQLTMIGLLNQTILLLKRLIKIHEKRT